MLLITHQQTGSQAAIASLECTRSINLIKIGWFGAHNLCMIDVYVIKCNFQFVVWHFRIYIFDLCVCVHVTFVNSRDGVTQKANTSNKCFVPIITEVSYLTFECDFLTHFKTISPDFIDFHCNCFVLCCWPSFCHWQHSNAVHWLNGSFRCTENVEQFHRISNSECISSAFIFNKCVTFTSISGAFMKVQVKLRHPAFVSDYYYFCKCVQQLHLHFGIWYKELDVWIGDFFKWSFIDVSAVTGKIKHKGGLGQWEMWQLKTSTQLQKWTHILDIFVSSVIQIGNFLFNWKSIMLCQHSSPNLKPTPTLIPIHNIQIQMQNANSNS